MTGSIDIDIPSNSNVSMLGNGRKTSPSAIKIEGNLRNCMAQSNGDVGASQTFVWAKSNGKKRRA